LQTVGSDGDPPYRQLLQRFFARTGVPIIINTSFNIMGEPIVETPEDALWCLLATELDYCVLGDRIVRRSPAFRSLLDLVPRLIAEEVNFSIRTTDGVLRMDLDEPQTRVTVACVRPWGRWRMQIPLEWLAIMELIDGRKTGKSILEQLQSASQSTMTPVALGNALRVMRRAGAIALERPR
jgi:carbamoyltransferase